MERLHDALVGEDELDRGRPPQPDPGLGDLVPVARRPAPRALHHDVTAVGTLQDHAGVLCRVSHAPRHLLPLLFEIFISYGFGSLLAVPLLRPLEEECLGGAGFLPAHPESAVEALDVGEDALPVGLLHPNHILHVEQGADVAVFPGFEVIRIAHSS